MAMACFAERAPCLPSRTWWISSRTNSPAWVLADLPFDLAFWARRMVVFSGIVASFEPKKGARIGPTATGSGMPERSRALAKDWIAVQPELIDEVRRNAGARAYSTRPDADVVLAARVLGTAGAEPGAEHVALGT